MWKVGTHVSRFDPEPEVWKTIWIVADGVVGEVKITGRRLDGPGTVVFPTYERDEGYYETGGSGNPENFKWQRTELVLKAPYGIREDHRTTVAYPSAGCWQFTFQAGTETVQIALFLYQE